MGCQSGESGDEGEKEGEEKVLQKKKSSFDRWLLREGVGES
jgi:hypothetical protein